MKSKTSFFNKTIFKKNVTLYWPLWSVYTLFLLGGLPVNLWFSLQSYGGYSGMTGVQMVRALYYVTQPAYYIMVIVFAAVFIGMALFSYLYKSQSANMIHSLPVDRTELFGTNVISGLVFLIVPQILTFVATVLVCLSEGITKVEYLGIWLLVAVATAFIAYAFVTFCAFLTGQLVALPIYVVIMNFLAYAFNYLVGIIVALFGYGVNNIEGLLADDILIWFSPLVCYLSKVDISYTRNAWDQISGIQLEGTSCILVYLAVAIVLYVAAYFIYRMRKIEHAGDLITVGILKPIFRWGVGTLAGFYVTVFFTTLFDEIGFEFSIISFVIELLVFGVIFYFIADMFVRKTFKVFKRQNWKGCGRFCIVTLALFAVIALYANVEEKRVPDLEDVETASIRMGYSSSYKNEEAQKVIAIHKKILENVDYYEKLDRNNTYYYYDDDTEWINITYSLSNGDYITRSYQIPYEDEGKEIIDAIRMIELEPENVLKNLLGNNYEDIDKISYGYVELLLQKQDSYQEIADGTEWESRELTATQGQKLLDAIIADGLAGRLNKYNAYYSSAYEEDEVEGRVFSIQLETTTTEKVQVGVDDYEEYSSYKYIHVEFGRDCENIINAIVELGIFDIDSADDIYWED